MTRNLQKHGIGRSIALGVLTGISIAVVFSAGFFFRGIVSVPPVFASNSENVSGYPLVDEVQHLLDQHFLRQQPEYTERQYAAIRGVLSSLDDRYTFFNPPPVAQSTSDSLAGTYGGVGVQIQRDENGRLLLYPFPESPAASAGIVAGDLLLAINGGSVDLSVQQDVLDQMLRGEVKDGNGVELAVERVDGEQFSSFIPFAVINIPSVTWRVLAEDDRIGYVQILRFTSRTPEELTEALTVLLDENDVEGLVLDLRNNSGGLLQESVEVAGQFLNEGDIVLIERDRDSEQVFDVNEDGLAVDIPLVVLVNHGTASASELVAGAIQDHGRGLIIGQQTYGKGTVQQIFRLSDESSLHITSAEWLTPERSQIEGIGLEPTTVMIPDSNGRDVELGEAVRQLRQILS